MAEQLPEQLPDPAASGELDQELLLNDFAIRSFRHVGDGDYIAARMASRAQLVAQFLWSSQQALEKYLKCILLLRRIPANSGTHSLTDLLNKIDAPGAFAGALTRGTQSFIARLDQYGRFSRYLEVSNVGFGKELLTLDRAVWEIRRYCELDSTTNAALELRNGQRAPCVRLEGGFLEGILDDKTHPAREALLWQNGFFGNRKRRKVRIGSWFRATNSPLFLRPELLDEVSKYVHFPKSLKGAYREHKRPT